MTPLPDYRKVAPARALLGWKQKTLAGRLGTCPSEIHRLEAGWARAQKRWLFKAFTALRGAGVEFHDRGVSLRDAA